MKKAIHGIIIVLILLIVATIPPKAKQSKYFYNTTDSLRVWSESYATEPDQVYVTNNDGGILSSISTEYQQNMKSMDGSVCATITNDDNLYIIDQNAMKKVADHVINCFLSADGTQLIYVINQNGEESGKLYKYDIKQDEIREIADNCKEDSITMSPDGSTVAYIRLCTGEYKYELCVIDQKNKQRVIEQTNADHIDPVAVADNAKYVYYLVQTDFYAVDNGKKECLSNELLGMVQFNYDLSQVLFKERDQFYLKTAGSKRKSFSICSCMEPVLPDKVLNYSACWIGTPQKFLHRSCYAVIYGINDFRNQLYWKYDNYCYIDGQLKEHEICPGDVQKYKLSENGNQMLYTHSDSLYYISDLTKRNIQPQKIINYVDEGVFYTDSELNHIYYINGEQTLMYMDEKREPIKVASKIFNTEYSFRMEDHGVYFLEDMIGIYGKLYYWSPGEQKKAVEDADYVKFIDQKTTNKNAGNEIYCLKANGGGTYNTYLLQNGKSKLLFENTINNR